MEHARGAWNLSSGVVPPPRTGAQLSPPPAHGAIGAPARVPCARGSATQTAKLAHQHRAETTEKAVFRFRTRDLRLQFTPGPTSHVALFSTCRTPSHQRGPGDTPKPLQNWQTSRVSGHHCAKGSSPLGPGPVAGAGEVTISLSRLLACRTSRDAEPEQNGRTEGCGQGVPQGRGAGVGPGATLTDLAGLLVSGLSCLRVLAGASSGLQGQGEADRGLGTWTLARGHPALNSLNNCKRNN